MNKATKPTLPKELAKPVAAVPEGKPGAAGAGAGASGSRFPIIGIGASAGGLAAFEAFFAGMPEGRNPGMAFILVQHLAPDRESLLVEIIRRSTSMKVFEVLDGMAVSPDCVYVIPPNRDLALMKGALHLLEPQLPHGHRLPIDFFFRSLAADLHERAIAIVLSGTGSDGSLGVRAIKGEGGLILAQSTESTEYDGMPRSAIATGLVDEVLPPGEMPARLAAHVAHPIVKIPAADGVPDPDQDLQLKKVFLLLRAQVGHDFSQYKPSSIHRRLERRMAVQRVASMDDYVKFLQKHPPEVEALFRDLLIGVTHFFRDPEAWKSLAEQVVERILGAKPEGSPIRIWVAGCSTGEEAYSLAILFTERMEALGRSYPLQVFASDIDRQAIAKARTALYPPGVAADILPDRLSKYFTVEPAEGGYRIKKSIRDQIIFSEQDLILDPPFSKLDLISCRNLLIYLGAELQKVIIPRFHAALSPGACLFLGSSETVGEFGDLFDALDRKAHLYLRKEGFTESAHVALSRLIPKLSFGDSPKAPAAEKPAKAERLPLRQLTEKALLQHLAPSSALVNGQGDILYLHGRAGMFLEPAQGEAGVNNILKMAREGLQHELTKALKLSKTENRLVRVAGLLVKTNGHSTRVDLCVRPIRPDPSAAFEEPLFLILLEEPPPREGGESSAAGARPLEGAARESGSDARVEELRLELRVKEEILQAANEELQSTNEELKSSNEEMQSVNEELQSTNEELETSKEESQSVNEELSTVNAELQEKMRDLTRVNNDMSNLLAGTGIGTVFVDHELRILRFTPAISAILNLIPGDVGRPVGHLVSNLVGYDRLVADAKEVLDSLAPALRVVQTRDGKWFSMRIQPYRTHDHVIEGAVISFVDITEMEHARLELRKANELLRLAVVVRDSHDAITVQDLDGRTLAWNPGAVRLYGWTEAEALGMNVRLRIPKELQRGALDKIHQLSQAAVLEPYSTRRVTKSGAVVSVTMVSTALMDEAGKMYAIATTERLMATDREASLGQKA